MKVKLLIILAFLVLMDLACSKGCKNEMYEIIAIKDLQTYEMLPDGGSKPYVRNMVPYDSFVFKMTFVENLITELYHFDFIQSSYAREACHPPYTTFRIDSIKIYSIGNHDTIDVTDHFSLSGRRIDNSSDFNEMLFNTTREAGIELYFKLIEPPVKKDTFQFNFKLYEFKKLKFEKMSSSLVIVP